MLQLNKNLVGYGFTARRDGELIALGDELELAPAKLLELKQRNTLPLLLMLIENLVSRGKLPPREDHALAALTGSGAGGERLRFRRHLDDVRVMLADLGVAALALLAAPNLAEQVRLYDLMHPWRTKPEATRAAAAAAAKRKPASVDQFVELCEANLALAERSSADPATELDQALQAAHDHAGTAVASATRDGQLAAVQGLAKTGALRFGSPSAAAYHWLKHGDELAPPGTKAGAFAQAQYLARANQIVAADGARRTIEVEQAGAIAFVFEVADDQGEVKVVVKVVGGLAHLATCFRRSSGGRDATTPALPIEALTRVDGVSALLAPPPAPPAEQVQRLVEAIEGFAAGIAPGATGADARTALGYVVPWARQRIAAVATLAPEQQAALGVRLDKVVAAIAS